MERPVHPSFGWVKLVCCGWEEISVDGEEMKEQKRTSKIIDTLSYALNITVSHCHHYISPIFDLFIIIFKW